MTLPTPPLLVITDRHRCLEPLEKRVEALFSGGCRWISVRENDLDVGARLLLLRRLCNLARAYGALVTVHRDLAAAMQCQTGLHLPAGADPAAARRHLGDDRLIGVSCHGAAELARAGAADYATVSPVFQSGSKPGYGPPLGPDTLRMLALRSPVPVLALGGVTIETLPILNEAKMSGVAVMGEAMSIADPAGWCAAMIAGLHAQEALAGFT